MKRRLSFVIIMVMVIVMIAGCGKATSSQKPAEATSSQKPAEATSSQKPAETTSEQKPAETTSEQKPAEITSEQEPAETTSEQKPAETIIKDGFFKAYVSGEEVFSVELPSDGEWQALAFVTEIDCGLAYNKDNRKIYRIDSFSIKEVAEVSDFMVFGEILYFVSPEKEGYINQWAFVPQNIKVCENAISVSADPPGFILGDGNILNIDL